MNELFDEFQEFRKILCICPGCGKLVRVSDLRLRTKGKVTPTWLDKFESDEWVLAKREEAFAEKEGKLREKAREKGRKAATKVINAAISPGFKALKLDPHDVKPVFHPINFLVFKGMNAKDRISDIMLLCKQYACPALTPIRRQIETAVEKENYGWQVARIDDEGKITFE